MSLPPYDPYSTYQCLGRMHRVGWPKPQVLVIPVDDFAERMVLQNIQSKIVALGDGGSSTGISLHSATPATQLLPYQKRAMDRLLAQLDKLKKSDRIISR